MTTKNDEKTKVIEEYLRDGFGEIEIFVNNNEPPFCNFTWEYNGKTYSLKFHPDPFLNLDEKQIKIMLHNLNTIYQLKTNGINQIIKAEPVSGTGKFINTISPHK